MPFARRALGNAAPRANKKKERKRKGRTHRYSIGWKGRTEQSWGWSRTCFFLLLVLRFVCVRVDVLCPFFSRRKRKKRRQNNGLGYLLFSHPKHRRGPNSRGEGLAPHKATPSKYPEWPRERERRRRRRRKRERKRSRAPRLFLLRTTIVDREKFLLLLCFSRHVERERDEPKRALLRPRWLSRGGEKDHFERVRVAERALVAETNARGTSGTFEVRHHARFVRRSGGFTANWIHVRTRGYFQMVAK